MGSTLVRLAWGIMRSTRDPEAWASAGALPAAAMAATPAAPFRKLRLFIFCASCCDVVRPRTGRTVGPSVSLCALSIKNHAMASSRRQPVPAPSLHLGAVAGLRAARLPGIVGNARGHGAFGGGAVSNDLVFLP